MAVTGAIFKSLTFNGESSRNYGIYITGEGVYNAPTRDVEMITIPGKNGSFPLDHGRFENIEVTYPAGVYADNEEDFADAISDFRNMLCSAKGYCRLEDEYNPDEYRMAIYKSGLEVEPAQLKAGEFEIVFECKPQRYLKSGETAVTIGASTSLTNPTRFESSPELRVKGYGTIEFNNYKIEIDNVNYGDVILLDNKIAPYNWTFTLGTDEYAINNDTITVNANAWVHIRTYAPGGADEIKSATVTTPPDNGTPYFTLIDTRNAEMGVNGMIFGFSKGTTQSKSTSETYSVTVKKNGTTFTVSVQATYQFSYDATNDTIMASVTRTVTPANLISVLQSGSRSTISASVYGSKSALGDPTIIDCENGEVYKETPDGVVSLNSYINRGATLPKLATGTDTVTTSGNITECKLSPRWWKV